MNSAQPQQTHCRNCQQSKSPLATRATTLTEQKELNHSCQEIQVSISDKTSLSMLFAKQAPSVVPGPAELFRLALGKASFTTSARLKTSFGQRGANEVSSTPGSSRVESESLRECPLLQRDLGTFVVTQMPWVPTLQCHDQDFGLSNCHWTGVTNTGKKRKTIVRTIKAGDLHLTTIQGPRIEPNWFCKGCSQQVLQCVGLDMAAKLMSIQDLTAENSDHKAWLDSCNTTASTQLEH